MRQTNAKINSHPSLGQGEAGWQVAGQIGTMVAAHVSEDRLDEIQQSAYHGRHAT
jgi:hypothetical protein